ncbi:MAG TPA: metallophosphoesterase [Thermoplasmata archaeon]|nr:metallophosphoesterase [Thermoplasmata archaeon]
MPRDPAFRLPQPVFDEPVFAEGRPTPDPTRFRVPHPSDAALYRRLEQLLYEDVVGIPPARGAPADLYALASAWGPHGPEVVQGIETAGRIVFHTVGDIGASSEAHYPGEIRVSDRLTAECAAAPAGARPAFLYLLGDLIYDFGEARYYYDEFYEPYRNYPAPIFAIPGNHDSFVVPGTAAAQAPLVTFQRNFCAAEPVVTPEAGSLHRTAMTQPGVYFALDAPFVRILGLFSNALEDPGVLSSEGGRWANVSDVQLAFLTAQLTRAKAEAYPGALLLAVHHPPFNYAPPASGTGAGGTHGGSPGLLADIDRICSAVGVYPHAILAGHAHNYQRYTRTVAFGAATYEVPFLVCGGGGHDVDPLVRARAGGSAAEPPDGADVSYLDPHPAVDARGLVLERHDDRSYGFLRVTVDDRSLRFEFEPVGAPGTTAGPADSVAVDLAAHTLLPVPPSKRAARSGGRASGTHDRAARAGRSRDRRG